MRWIGTVIAGACLLASCGSGNSNDQAGAPAAGVDTMNAAAEDAALDGLADNAVEAVDAGEAGSAAGGSAEPVDLPRLGSAPPEPSPLPPTRGPASAEDDIFCRPLRVRTSASECRDFTEQAASLEQGVGAFNPPAEMVRGQAQDVIFSVGAEADRDAVIEATGGNAATAVTVATKIGRFMTASLSGGGFTIVADGVAERDLGASGRQSWTWRVTPTADGPQPLKLNVSVEAVGADGQRTAIQLSNKTVTVRVAVSPADQRSARIAEVDRTFKETTPLFGSLKTWLLALAGVIAAASAVWIAIRKFGRDTPPKPPKSGSGE